MPERWTKQHGAFYYYVPKGLESLWDNKKMFRLGKTEPEAYREWAKRAEVSSEVKTINQLLERYMAEVVPLKAVATQKSNQKEVKNIRAVFGEMPLTAITSQEIYKYADKRGKPTAARLEIALLSHAYTKAVEWGYIKAHPFKKEVRLHRPKPRTRYIEDWEIAEALALKPTREAGSVLMIQAYIELKLLTGLRKTDMLKIKTANITESGVLAGATSKTGKPLHFKWTAALRAAIEKAKEARLVDIGPYLFCNKYGRSYVNDETGDTTGFDSMWQRFMTRIIEETKVENSFTEHDLRAKCGSDAESLARAQELLGHMDASTTKRVYRRKIESIQPAK